MKSHKPSPNSKDSESDLEQLDAADDLTFDGPSKSQLKRDAQALLELGKQLVSLDASKLAKIPLESVVRTAVEDARKIKAHGALKRQYQFIAKLLRQIETEDIVQALQQTQQESARTNANFQQCERWREKLLNHGKEATEAFINEYPDIDRQKLRQLIRNADKEAKTGKPPKWYRELFRFIRATVDS